jgi:transcriptional regulator with XRE-family HTH domain
MKMPLATMLEYIGLALQTLRKQKGYQTIKEFVQKYELPEIQYWRIERGKANLTVKSLGKILTIHDMSIEDFFCNMTSLRAGNKTDLSSSDKSGT